MIHDIMEVFLANLAKLEWMDDVTKEKAREKVGTRKNKGLMAEHVFTSPLSRFLLWYQSSSSSRTLLFPRHFQYHHLHLPHYRQ